MESIILLPSVVKGTDSRVGLGFHLGHHADIQTIFEVGPQKFTKPLRRCIRANRRSSNELVITSLFNNFLLNLENHVEYSSNAHKRMAKQFNYGHALKVHPYFVVWIVNFFQKSQKVNKIIILLLQRKTNGYGHLEGQKDDFSTPQVYLGRPYFGIKNQFPLPPQPIYLNGDHS